MRGKSKIKVKELNLRLKQLTGCPYDIDLRKMTISEVEKFIWNSRLKMSERFKEAEGKKALNTKIGKVPTIVV